MVLGQGAPYFHIRHPEAFADQLSFLLREGLSPVAGDRFFQGLLPHDRTMHLFLGKAAQKRGDIVVGYLFGLFYRLALEHFRQGRGRSNGAGTSEGLEPDIHNPFVFIHLEGQFQGVPTRYGSHLAHPVGIFDHPDIPGV